MKPRILWFAIGIIGVIILAYALYLSRASQDRLNDIEPHAAEEIEKAKRR